ncbi:MAG TPA: hypothetical protein VID70_02790 [Solirubrobacteraceae bacterium]|jgi:hypothetical protein
MTGMPHEEGKQTESPGNSGEDDRETYGPLDIARHRKEDGRALILFAFAKRKRP